MRKDINKNKYFKIGTIETIDSLWENGEDKDMLIKNLFNNARIMKKHRDLEREQKNILKNLTCTKDIIKFGDIYK